jgi:hypothetical protein
MSANQGIINRQTFGMSGATRNPMVPIDNRLRQQNSREDLSSDDQDMRSFN